MSAKAGGPAFPVLPHPETTPEVESEGMTLREWFAGKALGAVIETLFEDGNTDPEDIAGCAYNVADAMLAARATP